MRTVMLVRHRVADFDRWRAAYDEAGPLQREGGVREHSVWRAPGDAEDVTVVHVFDDEATARAFPERPELRKAMEDAGADVSTLQVAFLEEVLSRPV